MIRNASLWLIALLVITAANSLTGQSIEQVIEEKIPGASVMKLDGQEPFSEVLAIQLRQPLDHQDTTQGFFSQRLFLSHRDFSAPMLIVTEGYAARNTKYELADMLQSNQLIVEYRFFGASRPDEVDWTHLTNDQAMEDLHRIRTLFGAIYKSDWVSTGISKGGTTTLIYRSKYPDDVVASVPYVAPLALAQEDKRTEKHLRKVGEKACRKKLVDFQKMVLENREAILPMIEQYAEQHKRRYSLGVEKVLEYAVLELPFSFWQWGGECDAIPEEGVSPDSMFNYIHQVVDWSFYSDATCNYFKPAFYQFMTELGYYGYSIRHLDGLITALATAPNNQVFAPQDAPVRFSPYLQEVVDFLDQNGDRIIYIYGELDPWTACGYEPKKRRDALLMVKEGGDHTTRIADLSAEQRAEVKLKLDEWLKDEEQTK